MMTNNEAETDANIETAHMHASVHAIWHHCKSMCEAFALMFATFDLIFVRLLIYRGRHDDK